MLTKKNLMRALEGRSNVKQGLVKQLLCLSKEYEDNFNNMLEYYTKNVVYRFAETQRRPIFRHSDHPLYLELVKREKMLNTTCSKLRSKLGLNHGLGCETSKKKKEVLNVTVS